MESNEKALGREVIDAETTTSATDWTEHDGQVELASASEAPLPPHIQLSEHDHSIAKREVYAAINSIPTDGPPLPPQIEFRDPDDSNVEQEAYTSINSVPLNGPPNHDEADTAYVNELRPPVPFDVPEFYDDDLRKKRPIDTQQKLVNESRRSILGDVPELEGQQNSTVFGEEIPDNTDIEHINHTPNNFDSGEEDEESPHVSDGEDLSHPESGPAAGTVTNQGSYNQILNARVTASVRSLSGEDNSIPIIPEAYLVEENEEAAGEVVEGQPINNSDRKLKMFQFATLILGISMAVVVGVFLGTTDKGGDPEESEAGILKQQYCSPCIDRSTYKIKALLRADESIENKLVPSARQSAKDMGVNLEVKIYDEGDEEQMADDIRSVAAESGAHALIVTVNSKAIANAVRYAADLEMPVFGVNSGFEFAEGPMGLVEDGSMLFFTAMNGRLGGEMAASYFLKQLSEEHDDGKDATTNISHVTSVNVGKTYSRALFVSLNPPEKSISAFEQGYEGYHDLLRKASNSTIKVEKIQVEMPQLQEDMKKAISDCRYQSILIGESHLVQPIKLVIEESGCNQIKVGVFDRTPELDSKLAKGELDFVMDQFHDRQGYAAVQLATLYVTTGIVVPPPPGGVHFSGPSFMTMENTATQGKLNICEEDPSAPGCFDRNNITIGGVVHGTGNDRFWDMIFSAAEQSAIDMGVELKFDRFGPEENLYEKMGSKITSLCKSGIAGLFVTIPDEGVIDAVRNCQELNPNLQILSINAGYEKSKELNLVHHIGMLEDDAGYQAGIKMEEMATFNKALCFNHGPGLNTTIDRCKGFGRSMNNMGIEYLGQISAQDNSSTSFVSAVDRAVGEPGDWDGYGMLLTGLMPLPAALELKKLHEKLAMGAFDTDSLLYEALDTGDILFGVDQQPYLQGYLPIPLLIHAILTKNTFAGHALRTGPRFIIAPPTDEEADCKSREYPVCSIKRKLSITT